ncbi:acyl carrier protein [Pseudonocardia autotrophica]|uniref:D-alanine--poly(Phosphoribitol) ligase subunit 2 n=2 Tax=Pseudonocardia TaxID=1847 RepID=A0A1Y2N9C7_PSEAH|nr:D-alanine--poly(phosphoribitol) ligase subunit 2 [Pseudonocardia autotrophica]TDN73353.1 acyl carrier protein [Pseudonocardia autotrophica]BBG04091.1 hypothetical protein Pdca_53000 [Pseudonocardia autotrophica]GEC26228.1 hypothetical protein PSA01_32570 [Pseudonocardia saturnea]
MNHVGAPSESVEARVRGIVEDLLTVSVVSVDVDLVDTGLLDSLALVTIIGGMEDEFGCELPLEEFDPSDFRTITGIAAFVQRVGVAEALPSAAADA